MAKEADTYVEVYCNLCVKPMGYVVNYGHQEWIHESCAEQRGAVAIGPPYGKPIPYGEVRA
jgi:hypothetical protein